MDDLRKIKIEEWVNATKCYISQKNIEKKRREKKKMQSLWWSDAAVLV
jgi:hypothetical protein